MPSLELKQEVSRDLCRAVRESRVEDVHATAAKHGLKVEQAWRAQTGEGFKAIAARFMVDAEDVLIVAFRSTFGGDEWLEYPQKYWKRKFLPHDGEKPGSGKKLFAIWSDTLNEVWNVPGDEMTGRTDTLRGMIWRQLNAGNRVWLAGHSKGGAVATAGAARLLLGDSVVDADLPDPAVRRPEAGVLTVVGGSLSRLSVFTYNAPMAFAEPLAAAYEARLAEVGAEHVRFENKADRVRKLPAGQGLMHVGNRELQGPGILEDTGVMVGAALAFAGGVAALLSVTRAIANSH